MKGLPEIDKQANGREAGVHQETRVYTSELST